MQKYSSTAIDLFYNSKFSGATVGADVIAKNENKESGEIVKVYLVVRKNTIKSCSFQAMGSINLFACMSTICELSIDKSLEDAEKINEKDIINSLKQISKQDYNKVTFAVQSLQKAIVMYKRKRDNGTLNQRNSKKKDIYPSKNITVFTENENSAIENEFFDASSEDEVVDSTNIAEIINEEKTEENTENSSSKERKKVKSVKSQPKVETKKVADKKTQKQSKAPKKAKSTQVATSSELQVVPVGGKKANKPTRIDVRVVEEDKEPATISKVITTTTETQKTVDGKVVENTSNTETKVVSPDGKENMIDEIDTITEQLTNAISQLNFTFDETPEEEQKSKKQKNKK